MKYRGIRLGYTSGYIDTSAKGIGTMRRRHSSLPSGFAMGAALLLASLLGVTATAQPSRVPANCDRTCLEAILSAARAAERDSGSKNRTSAR